LLCDGDLEGICGDDDISLDNLETTDADLELRLETVDCVILADDNVDDLKY